MFGHVGLAMIRQVFSLQAGRQAGGWLASMVMDTHVVSSSMPP